MVELVLPSLRDRREDIPALVEEFRRRYALRFGLDDVQLSPRAIEALAARDWPGNVRELENAVARLLALSTGGVLDESSLVRLEPSPRANAGAGGSFRERVAAFEREVVSEALEQCGGNQSEAARRLGLTRVTLIDKMKRYGLALGKGPR